MFTLDDLKSIMETVLDDPVDLSAEDILDTPLADLGYDSLSLVEIATRIHLEHGIHVPDEVATAMLTPRDFLDYVRAEPLRSRG